MVVSTSVSRMRGRHSARPPGAPIRAVLAVLGTCLVVAAGAVAGLTAVGSGNHPPRRTAAIGTGSDLPEGRLNVTTSAPVLSPATTSAPVLSPREIGRASCRERVYACV